MTGRLFFSKHKEISKRSLNVWSEKQTHFYYCLENDHMNFKLLLALFFSESSVQGKKMLVIKDEKVMW